MVTSRSLHQLPLSTLVPLVLSRTHSSTSLSTVSDGGGEALSDVDDLRDRLIQSMKRLSLFDKGPQEKASRLLDGAFRYHGSSTTYKLVSATRELRTRYLLESMGVDVGSIAGELEKGQDHRHALESGLRRQEYWHSPDVSVHTVTVVSYSLSFLATTLTSCGSFCLIFRVYSGNLLMKGISCLRTLFRGFSTTGHRRIWLVLLSIFTSFTATGCFPFCIGQHLCATSRKGYTNATFGSHARACAYLPLPAAIPMIHVSS